MGIFPLLLLLWLYSSFTSTVKTYEITANSTIFREHSKTFSYIIVGGGTAGLTIANRLTENPNVTVLVIEAGRDVRSDPRVTDPGGFGAADFSDLAWDYVSTNQSLGNRSQSLTVGKALGGSSAINGMQWTRGTVGQYDALEKLGNPGWNFASMQKYMKKSEHFYKPTRNQTNLGVTFQPSAHGFNGRVSTGFPNPYPCPLCNLWDTLVDATAKVFPGIKTTGDLDQCSGDPRGVARCSYSIFPGTESGPDAGTNIRSSSAKSYIYSLSPDDRPNLHILVEHRAANIVWDTSNSPCSPQGVMVQAENDASQSFLVEVDREVIVTSGALSSPTFLQRSGIGDRGLLQSLGIPVKSVLPEVGTNLQDQAGIFSLFNASFQMNTTVDHWPAAGAAAFITLPEMLGDEAAKSYVEDLKDRLMERAQAIVDSGGMTSLEGAKKVLEVQLEQFGEENAPVVEIVYLGLPAMKAFAASTWILLPQYRGNIKITSRDSRVLPAINPNYLTTIEDFNIVVNASIATRKIFSQPAVKKLYSSELAPGPSVQTVEDFTNYVFANYGPVAHFIGTVPMLPRELGGAVDSELNVYGVKGVRVADASILPIQISAHLQSTVYGIAEKAADLIMKDGQASARRESRNATSQQLIYTLIDRVDCD